MNRWVHEMWLRWRKELFVGSVLTFVTLLIYWPVAHHEFIKYDDPLYVTDNPQVQLGVTMPGMGWAFTELTGNGTYWHPVTWLSHMLDCQFFGVNARAHHLMNVGFHVGNTLLLFFLLRKLTGAVWRSALVAALFAWHPLQVDTVAWVAERKNLLSTFFALLTIFSYVRYAELWQKRSSQYPFIYLLTLFWYAAGLMSKPMLVTLPCVLWLLDYWPLRRFVFASQNLEKDKGRVVSPARLILEKIPFLMLAGISSAITFLGHKKLNLIIAGEKLPLGDRLANAAVSYGRYLGKIFWPTHLAIYYPPEGPQPLWLVVSAIGLLLLVSGLVVWCYKSQPFLSVGWFWFVGTLVPVIGVVQAGVQSIADRFVYIPIIGLSVALVWGIGFYLEHLSQRKVIAIVLSGAILASLIFATTRQLGCWQNTMTVFAHALDVTENNVVAHVNLGTILRQAGKDAEAERHFARAVELSPDSIEAHSSLAQMYEKRQKWEEAEHHYRETVRLDSNNAMANNNLGVVLLREEETDEAVKYFSTALRIDPKYAEAHYNLAIALSSQDKFYHAILEYKEAIKIRPGYAEARNNLATLLVERGDFENASVQLKEALQLHPEDAEAHFNLSYVLYKMGRKEESQQHYDMALRLNPNLLKKRETN